MTKGIFQHPEWYPGLDASSSFKDFQASLNGSGHGNCSLPCGWPSHVSADGGHDAPCLCIFDVDRTLTGKQRSAKDCPGTKEFHGIYDGAYGGGTFVASKLAMHLHETFCHRCYRGIVTAGTASGPLSKERARVLRLLGGIGRTLSNTWSRRHDVHSSLVVEALDGHKHESVRHVVDWFEKSRGIRIEPKRVHFFDDRLDNVKAFTGSGFSARQISCSSRGQVEERLVGFCGGRPDEIVEDIGVRTCPVGGRRLLHG